MLVTMGLNGNRNHEGNIYDGLGFNARGLVGDRWGPVNHWMPSAYEDDSDDEDGRYWREARRNREARDYCLKVDIPSFSGDLDIKSILD